MRTDDDLLELNPLAHDMTIPEFQRWAQLKRDAWDSYICVQLVQRWEAISAVINAAR